MAVPKAKILLSATLSQTYDDLSGEEHVTTPSASMTINPIMGAQGTYAYNFNNDPSANIVTDLSIDNWLDISFSLWCKLDNVQSNRTLATSFDTIRAFLLRAESAQFQPFFFTAQQDSLSVNILPLSVWVHIAIVRDAINGTLEIFYDAVSQGSKVYDTDPFRSGTSPVNFGASNSGDRQALDGIIDSMRIYDTTLTISDIQELASGRDWAGDLSPSSHIFHPLAQ